MRTRQSYLNEIIAYLDGRIEEKFIDKVHEKIVLGLHIQHRRRLDEEISSVGLTPAVEVGRALLLRAAGVSTIPASHVWQVDSDLQERLIGVYTEYVWTLVNGQTPSVAPSEFRSREVLPGGSDPFPN